MKKEQKRINYKGKDVYIWVYTLKLLLEVDKRQTKSIYNACNYVREGLILGCFKYIKSIRKNTIFIKNLDDW